jgi:hypothetical protein
MVEGSILAQVASFICLLYNPERFVLRYDTNISDLGTPDLACREFRAFNPEIVVKFFNSAYKLLQRKCIRVLTDATDFPQDAGTAWSSAE